MLAILLRPQCVKGCNNYAHTSLYNSWYTIFTVSMVDVDGMVPLWYQDILNHADESNTAGCIYAT